MLAPALLCLRRKPVMRTDFDERLFTFLFCVLKYEVNRGEERSSNAARTEEGGAEKDIVRVALNSAPTKWA